MRAIRLIATGGWLAALACLAGCTAAPQRTAAPQPRDPGGPTFVAEIALERGDCRMAAESYATAAEHGDAALARRAAEVALGCEHVPAAWQAVRRWRALAPEDPDSAKTYAIVALKLHRIPEAQSALATLVAPAQGAQPPLAELIEQLLEEADAPAVLRALEGALRGVPLAPLSAVAMAELAMAAYDLDRAERYVRQALDAERESAEALRLVARLGVLRGDSAGALEAARQVMRVDASGGAFELAETLAALDRVEEARQELERLRVAGAATAEIDRRLALLALQSGDLEEARRRFTDLATRGEASVAALYYLADIAARDGDEETALAGFRQLADSPLALAARTRAAAILLEKSDRAGALALLDDYAADKPEHAFDLVLAKAHLLADHGERDTALELLEVALERHPEHPVLEYERAVMLERAGRVDEAVGAFERLLQRRPDDSTVLNALGYTLADHGRELSRAESLIRRALAGVPDSPAVLDSLGWVRFRRGDIRGALPLLERAYSLGRDPEIAAHWGEALWKSGSQQEARRIWAAALARHPDSEPLKATVSRFLPRSER